MNTEFSDLPFAAATCAEAMKWKRGRVWSSGRFKYDRPRACRVAVSGEAHRELRSALGYATWSWITARDLVLTAWPKGFLKEGRVLPAEGALPDLGSDSPTRWPDDFHERAMAAFLERLRAASVVPGGILWETSANAAGKALRAFKTHVEIGVKPWTYFAAGDTPCGVSALPVAGLAYGAPIARNGSTLAIAGLGDVILTPDEGEDAATLEGVERASYVELTHWERAWRLRMITATERGETARTGAGRAPREKKAAASKESAPLAAAVAPVEEDGFMGRIDEKGIAREGSRAGWDLGKTERYTKWLNWQIAHGKPYAK